MFNAAFILALGSTALAGALHDRDGHCGGDNCARQVTGTRSGLVPIETRRADCSSFMAAIPETTTTTVTGADGGYGYYPPYADPKAATDVPTYAPACRAAGKYSSACSCWGITAPLTRQTKTVTVSTSKPCPYS
ncbi:lipase/esterase family protein [Ophiocordyceps camponoti-floridani]|uniref:Lipase/esterase family protein n=1 Tax=Ophiocordyceps camponoti-floridani TaxID=2030778 RepID=A0A8H4VER3_9HYPO|nr:lipase/esterase family protein [Ophiocordyceps camponoti-floridani]